MNTFFWALKKFIPVFQELVRRARIRGVNDFQKLRYFGWSFSIVVVTFLKKWLFKLVSGSWEILCSRAFRVNLVIALVIELFLIAVPYHNHEKFPNWAGPLASHLHSWIREQEDVAMDWMIRMYRGSDLPEKQILEEHAPHSFVWLNIDEKTHSPSQEESVSSREKPESRWSNPLFTPRDRLLELIQLSVKHGAKIVIVDINLTHKTGVGGNELSDGDRKLYDYFKSYPDEPGHTPIVLAATIDDDEEKKCLKRRSSFLDDTVRGNIYWAAPTFYVETDGMIRRLKLWEKPTCPGEDSQAFPSIPLLTTALIRKPNGLIRKECDLHHFDETCFCAKLSGKGGANDILRRIIYRMPWKLEESETYPTIDFNGEASDLLKVISVRDLHGHEEDIKNRIVMIGASYEDTQDFYKTPLDTMPGALVIINAINSLFFDEKIPPLRMWQKLSLLTLIVFLISLFFTLFDSFVGKVVFYLLILLILVRPVSLVFFRAGILLDFGIPLAVLAIINKLPLKRLVSRSGKD